MIIYEYPLNERIRTLLRLENLFARAEHFVNLNGAFEHYAALSAIFEVLEVIARSDLKRDFISELERQKANLLSFQDNPDISLDILRSIVSDIEAVLTELHAFQGRMGQYLRENEWLMLVKGREMIPGGLCDFDLPSFHWWLHHDDEERSRYLHELFAKFKTPYRAISTILKLLRGSDVFESYTAERGEFRLNNISANTHLLRFGLDESQDCVPEISANKYFLGLRFLPAASRYGICKNSVERNVPFQVAFCKL